VAELNAVFNNLLSLVIVFYLFADTFSPSNDFLQRVKKQQILKIEVDNPYYCTLI
jgi:hypothetical protein